MPPKTLRIDKSNEIESRLGNLLTSYEIQGMGREAAIASAHVLQRFIVANWPKYEMPHGFSADTFARILICLLEKPSDERHFRKMLRLALRAANNEYKDMAAKAAVSATPEERRQLFRIIDNMLVPA